MKSQSIRTLVSMFSLILVAVVAAGAFGQNYLGPIDVVASADGKSLFVVNADAKQIAVVDPAGGKVSKSIAMPAQPTGLVLSPDGATLYVTCAAPQGSVCVVDVKAGKVASTIPAGHWAIGPAVSPDGKKLYVCNRFNDNVSVIDLATKKEIAKVPAVREPFAAAITPDGKTVFVINHLPIDPADGYDVSARITVIDAATNKATEIKLPNGSTGMRGICVSPDGKYAYATHILARYQMPTTQLERGWMNTNALSVIDTENKALINTVLLDDVDLGAASPWGVVCTADGAKILVTHASTHELSVIDSAALLDKLAKMPDDPEDGRGYSSGTKSGVPNDLSFLVDIRRRIYLQGGGPYGMLGVKKLPINGPRGLAVVGAKTYLTCYFTDTLAVVDLESKAGHPVTTIALGPAPKLTVQRRGEMLFNDAYICFQHWQSCASCHPDSRVDGLNWDLMNDGLGNPKNVRSMLLAHKTPPAMSSGIRETAEIGVRAGITHILFAVRPEEEAVAMDEYLKAMKPVPSPYLVNGQLSEAAKRGEKIFKDTGCATCHPKPLYTDLKMHDVGSKGQYDRRTTFDSPTLIECWRTAPYMHDGKYTTMKDLFVKGKHGKKAGDIDKLTQEQINDLVEYVLSL